jgi:hypothetical protein
LRAGNLEFAKLLFEKGISNSGLDVYVKVYRSWSATGRDLEAEVAKKSTMIL